MIKESGVDALVLDSLWRNLDLVAMHLGVPYSIYPSRYIRISPVKRRSGLTTGHTRHGPEAQARNLQGLVDLVPLVAPCETVTREYVDAWH